MTCDLRQLIGSAMGEVTRDRKRAEKEERDMSKIEWTGDTWNPIVGCTLASPGCTNCYAMSMAHRLGHNPATPHYAGTTRRVNGNTVWTGKLAMAPDHVLTAPLRRNKPTTYFVNSMGDLFHEDVPDDWIDRVFAVMALCPQHTFQVLTKRSARMREYIGRAHSEAGVSAIIDDDLREYVDPDRHLGIVDAYGSDEEPIIYLERWPLRNVWLGVSVEDQRRADDRIPDLLATPAAIRFISAEPLLGPVNLLVTDDRGHDISALRGIACDPTDPEGADEYYRTGKLDWVITGGESGPGARPMHPDWARSLRDQCVAADVPFFFKQWGEYADHTAIHAAAQSCAASDDLVILPSGGVVGGGNKTGGMVDLDWQERGAAWMCRVGKRAAGRLLDGREWNEVPTP